MVIALGPALGGRGEDPADEVIEAPAVAPGDDAQVAVDRVEAGEGVDLDEVGLVVAVAADVDARDVAAAERAVGVEGELADRGELGSVSAPEASSSSVMRYTTWLR
jgi:hypothetical protein